MKEKIYIYTFYRFKNLKKIKFLKDKLYKFSNDKKCLWNYLDC